MCDQGGRYSAVQGGSSAHPCESLFEKDLSQILVIENRILLLHRVYCGMQIESYIFRQSKAIVEVAY